VDLIESEVSSQCSKAIMQDLHSSATVQNAGDDVQLLVKMQKLSIIPQDHIGINSLQNTYNLYMLYKTLNIALCRQVFVIIK
jgi:hypothetical protein